MCKSPVADKRRVYCSVACNRLFDNAYEKNKRLSALDKLKKSNYAWYKPEDGQKQIIDSFFSPEKTPRYKRFFLDMCEILHAVRFGHGYHYEDCPYSRSFSRIVVRDVWFLSVYSGNAVFNKSHERSWDRWKERMVKGGLASLRPCPPALMCDMNVRSPNGSQALRVCAVVDIKVLEIVANVGLGFDPLECEVA